ncbi:hypothetical protein GCM10008929_19580 [Alkalibacterium psychrotolerans]|uniref:Microcompartment protein PduM n=1 Tax=Alkalibacterium indicireducens TaxID=398758 RepID=A0ABP3KC36_9LACT
MNDIVNRVISLLKKRENSVLTYDFKVKNPYSKEDFLKNQVIHIREMNVIILHKLLNLEENHFVSWVLDGLQYGIDFHFHLSSSMYQLIPLELTKWPIQIYNEKNQKIIICSEKAITYQRMMSFTDGSILIRTQSQIITALADEAREKKQINVIERF